MATPSDIHQDVGFTIGELLKAYQRQTKSGRMMPPPKDVLISRKPLRSRQPDVLYISNERLGSRGRFESTPLAPAPELVVEVLSPSESRSVRMAKI